MLNYLGPTLGGSPIAAQMPPASPGSIADGVPGLPTTPNVLSAAQPSAGPSPAHLAAIHPAPAPMEPPGPPPLPEYAAVTQEDGSILLHIRNPDGSLGPAVKIVPPVKPAGGASKPQ